MANGTIAVSQLDILTQSGTGVITVVPPATNTDRTLTLPDDTGTVLTSASSLAAGNLSGALPAIDGSALTALPPHPDRTHLVYSGWNSAHNTQTGVRVAYPLDADIVSVNTSYMTKSTGTFTCVKAGNYLINVTTMNITTSYAHHRMLKNGSHVIQTHDYKNASNSWGGISYCVAITLSVGDYISFDGINFAGSYNWHGGHSYSNLSIVYLNT